MGWLGRQFGLSCDNVASYTVVTADGETVRATATENPDLFWGLRGGGGNFGVVTEFEFRLHPTTGQALIVELFFDAADAEAPLRAWRDLLGSAPREALLTADVFTAPEAPFLPTRLHGRPVANIGYVWVGDMDAARAYLPTFRSIGTPVAEQVDEMTYVDLQSAGDANHGHGKRRYSAGHYLAELSDDAIAAFLTRGVGAADPEPDRARMPAAGFQAYRGAIAEVGEDDSAFSNRQTLVEFFAGATWTDPGEDAERMALARAWGAVMAPYARGAYVNALADTGDDIIRRVYRPDKLARLADLKRKYDPDNVFHLNQNIRPAARH
jgi:FAD/FMN-containing dehydrogenase